MKTKIPGPKKGLTDILDERIIEKLERNKSKYFPLRPSNAGKCARALAYDLMHYRGFAEYDVKRIEPALDRLFSLGHSVEWHVLKYYLDNCREDMGMLKNQQRVMLFQLKGTRSGDRLDKDGRWVEGAIDAYFYHEEWKGLIDVKSQKDRHDSAFKSKWDWSTAKYDDLKSLVKISATSWYAEDLEAFLTEVNDIWLADNFWQLNAYCHAIGYFAIKGIEFGSIIKYNKNDSRMYEIRFKPSKKMFDRLQVKYNAIQQAVDKKKPELVRKEYAFGSMRCAFCPYSDKCHGKPGALQAWYKTLPPKRWPVDTEYLDAGDKIEEMCKQYVSLARTEEFKKKLEQDILVMLDGQKYRGKPILKIRLTSGEIFDIKVLKHSVALRRGKL